MSHGERGGIGDIYHSDIFDIVIGIAEYIARTLMIFFRQCCRGAPGILLPTNDSANFCKNMSEVEEI
jgi:hypothetical protein